ncbi:MAG: DUF2252 family protein, partial [Armatimonadetes bacterium]|nr:DUF2252 family protein [Armatimonadota bacterium]
MNIIDATASYENWLRTQLEVNELDLDKKHEKMADSPFPFLRATFYRWIERLPKLHPQLLEAPVVCAVGDLHVDNFGTWRDAEGRLVWGINDFDEAYTLPYTLILSHILRCRLHTRLPLGSVLGRKFLCFCRTLQKTGRCSMQTDWAY